jgi:hypothetical protein
MNPPLFNKKKPPFFVIFRNLYNLHNQLPLVYVNLKQYHSMLDYSQKHAYLALTQKD